MGFFDKLQKQVARKIAPSAITKKVSTGVHHQVGKKKQGFKQGLKQNLRMGLRKFKTNLKAKVMNAAHTSDYKSFKKRWEVEGKDHVKTILLYLIAALEYSRGNDAGDAMATLVLPKPRLLRSPGSPSGYICNPKGAGYMLRHMRENPRVPPSFLGGGPDNDYAIDEKNLVLNIVEEGVSGREAVVVIQSAGKDFSTPCGLRMNSSGYWKIFKGYGSIATGVQKTEEEKWDF